MTGQTNTQSFRRAPLSVTSLIPQQSAIGDLVLALVALAVVSSPIKVVTGSVILDPRMISKDNFADWIGKGF